MIDVIRPPVRNSRSFFWNMKNILLVLWWLMAGSIQAGEMDILIQKANQSYIEGMYAQAAEQYKKVILLGYESSELYYNLGNAYYKMNDLPNAILWYERARRLDPGNEEINFNLKVANNKISDKIEPLPELFYIRWFRSLTTSYPSDTWAWGTVILFISSLFLGALYRTTRILILRKTGFWVGMACFILALSFLLFAWSSHHYLCKKNEAIIFAPTVTVKSSPDEKAIDLFVIHEGTRIVLKDRIGEWHEIQIANGSVGWIRASTLQKI
jgi:tetratricopeptide (TPR) repeat protein